MGLAETTLAPVGTPNPKVSTWKEQQKLLIHGCQRVPETPKGATLWTA
jgi:hypothetical protein